MIRLNSVYVDENTDFSTLYLNKGENLFVLKFESDLDFILLRYLKEYVDNTLPNVPSILKIPYLPYSRMDRQEENRLFTLKSIAMMLNEMNFTSVEIMEPHSEVSVFLLDRVTVVNKSKDLALLAMRNALGLQGSIWFNSKGWYNDNSDFCLEKMFELAECAGIYFVYPDAGAEKRYKMQINYSKILSCSKERDFNTGNIKSIKVNGAENAQDCKVAIIVDDLSSKGGTFVGSAKVLRDSIPSLETVILCVTHCENTIYDGVVLSGDMIDKVYTTNSIIKRPENPNFDINKLIVEEVF